MYQDDITSFEYYLRNIVCDGDINTVLKALHEYCGGQWVYSMNQDYAVYPDTPELSEAFFYPEIWKCSPANPAFPGVKKFSCDAPNSPRIHFIHSSLSIGSEVRHILKLRHEGTFTETDYRIIDYASLLTGYFPPLETTPKGINLYMSRAYEGIKSDCPEKGVFPNNGFAIVAWEQDNEGILKQQTYLAYRLHRNFRKDLRYCFLDETHLLLFVSTHNIQETIKRLEKILGTSGNNIIMGISDQYPATEMHLAMSEAWHAMAIGSLMNDGRHIFLYSNMSFFKLLEYPRTGSQANRTLDRMMEKLMVYSKEKRESLAKTMSCFVENQFNYQKTADIMYAHVNTIRYRISLLENIWCCDLHQENDRLLFALISKLLPLWINQNGYDE